MCIYFNSIFIRVQRLNARSHKATEKKTGLGPSGPRYFQVNQLGGGVWSRQPITAHHLARRGRELLGKQPMRPQEGAGLQLQPTHSWPCGASAILLGRPQFTANTAPRLRASPRGGDAAHYRPATDPSAGTRGRETAGRWKFRLRFFISHFFFTVSQPAARAAVSSPPRRQGTTGVGQPHALTSAPQPRPTAAIEALLHHAASARGRGAISRSPLDTAARGAAAPSPPAPGGAARQGSSQQQPQPLSEE